MLTDFGLAKGRAYTVLTKPGQVMGTLDYLAPELVKGEHATPATDIYALGCTIYECVAGQPPFADKEGIQVGLAHVAEPPPALSEFRDDLSAGVRGGRSERARQGSRRSGRRRPSSTATASRRPRAKPRNRPQSAAVAHPRMLSRMRLRSDRRCEPRTGGTSSAWVLFVSQLSMTPEGPYSERPRAVLPPKRCGSTNRA